MVWGELVGQKEGLLPLPWVPPRTLKQKMGLPGLGWGEVGAESVQRMIFRRPPAVLKARR